MTEIISFTDLSKNTLYAIIIGFYGKFISILSRMAFSEWLCYSLLR